MTSDFTLEKGLPANIDAEKSILGAILLDNLAYYEASARIQAEDFALDSHRRIYARMSSLMAMGRAVDIVTISDELAKHKEVEAIGGVAYLASLTEGLPRRISIEEYVRIVLDKSLLRQTMTQASRVISMAADGQEDAADIIAEWQASAQVLSENSTGGGLQTFAQFVKEEYPRSVDDMWERTPKTQGIPTGMKDFDRLTCGLQRQELIIVAARPSMGKTAWVVNVCQNVARAGYRVGLFSLEMRKQAILNRALSNRASVELTKIRRGELSAIERRYLSEELAILLGEPFYIDDAPAQSLQRIEAKATRMKAQVGLDLLVIDQLNHIHITDSKRNSNRSDDLGGVTRGCKAMSKRLDVPVVVLHQLNRDNAKRDNKRPLLSDLRDSGNIEQDADLVAFLHREEYYDKHNEDLKGKGEIIIAKQRDGATDTVHSRFEGDFCRWSDCVEPQPVYGGDW